MSEISEELKQCKSVFSLLRLLEKQGVDKVSSRFIDAWKRAIRYKPYEN